MLQWLETFGRYSLDPQHSGIDAGDMWSRIGLLYESTTRDPEGFLAELRAVVAGDQDGFATLGAARLVWELFSEEDLQIPAALALVDAGIAFKLSRGLPPIMTLTGAELRRFDQLRESQAGPSRS